jgi:hypothetical protein
MSGNPVPKYIRATTRVKAYRIQDYKNQSAKVQDPAIRKLRRQQIVMSKVMGLTNKHIGKVFGLAAGTIAHEINMAKKDGTLDDLNQRILDELVPDAIAVYKKKLLEEDDAFVAKDVLKHLERLTTRKDDKESRQEAQYSMQAYIEQKRQLPDGSMVSIEQTVKGEVAKAYLEQGKLEAAPPESMQFLKDIVVENEE